MARQELIDINCKKLAETAKAIRVDDGTKQAWLPLSQIEVENESNGTITVTMPLWLAKEKGFV